MTTRKPTTGINPTPQGQYVSEAPEISAPGLQHDIFGFWGTWLGNPLERYGHMVSSRNVPTNIKLEMLNDNVVALCVSFVGTMLLKARREIRCADESKRKFFEALFRSFEREFILQASVGIALGSLGLVKKWRFQVPEPTEHGAPPVWTQSATPYVVTGFDMVYPIGSAPRFDDKNKHFEGIDTASDGTIDAFHSLWLTFRKELAFGGYGGVGRLTHCYKPWWLKNFGADNFVVALQKEANRVVKTTYPPGKDSKSGKQNQTIALEVGDLVRSGATVAIPSDTYVTTGLDGEERQGAVSKWGIEFLQGAGTFERFFELENQEDGKICVGYFISPQAILQVTGGQLGSVTSAEVLGDLATEQVMQDAADIDRHLNSYVFPDISQANFPEGSPKVEVVTTGLDPNNSAQLQEIIKALIPTHADGKWFDLRAAMERLGFPLKSEEDVAADEKKAAAEAKAAQAKLEAETAKAEALAKAAPADETPSEEAPSSEEEQSPEEEPAASAVAAAISDEGTVVDVGSPLKPWPNKVVPVDDTTLDVAVTWWRDVAPDGAKFLLDAETLSEGENAE